MLPQSSGTEAGIGPVRNHHHRQRIANPPGQPYYPLGSFSQTALPSTPLPLQQTRSREPAFDESGRSFPASPYSSFEGVGDSVFSSAGPNPAGLAGQVATEFGLTEGERKTLHELPSAPPLMRELRLHAAIMAARREQRILKEQLAAQEETLRSVDTLLRSQWQPSGPQRDILKDLLRHYAVKTIKSYTKLADEALKYVSKKADSLRLPGYRNDMVMQSVMKDFLRTEAIEQKSALRKLIFSKCGLDEDGATVSGPVLSSMVTSILDDWHFGSYTVPVEQRVLARFALLRRIATPIARQRHAKNNTARGDTGFWTAVEKELSKARIRWNGDKQAELQWEIEQIEADKQQHPGEDNDDIDFNFNDDVNGDENDETNDPDATRLQVRLNAHDRDANPSPNPLADDQDEDDLAPAAM